MTIAFDIDGVLTDLEKYIKEEGREFFKKDIVDELGRDIDEIFGVSKSDKEAFWSAKSMDYIETYPLRDEASRVTHELHDLGYKVLIVTARKFNPSCHRCKDDLEYRQITEKILVENGIYFDGLYFEPSPKVDAVSKYNIDVFVEDEVRNIVPLSKVTKVIILNSSYNRSCDSTTAYRVKSLNDIPNLLKSW